MGYFHAQMLQFCAGNGGIAGHTRRVRPDPDARLSPRVPRQQGDSGPRFEEVPCLSGKIELLNDRQFPAGRHS
jgi:hypothetical protein